jgi:hypothetical protein
VENKNYGAYSELVLRLLPYWNCVILTAGIILFAGPLRDFGLFWGTTILELMSLSVLLAYFRFFRTTMIYICPSPQIPAESSENRTLARTLAVMEKVRWHKWVFLGCVLACWSPVVLAGEYRETFEKAMPSFLFAVIATAYHLREIKKFRRIAWYAVRMSEGRLIK